MSMGKFLNKQDYERFVKSLKGPLESFNGEIYQVHSETFNIFGCSLSIVIHDGEIGPDLISKLMGELATKFKHMYDEYDGMKSTFVRIGHLMITGGLDVNIDYIGINLVNSSTTVLPMNKLQWIKEPHTVNDIIQYTTEPVVQNLMTLENDTVEKINRGIKQLQSQKNVPHNLHVHLDFIEEGTFKLNGLDVHYKLPDNIKLTCHSDPRNHNKITGFVDFDFLPIHVEYPIDPVSGRNMYDTLVELLTGKMIDIFKSNDLTPDRYAANNKKPNFNFIFKFTG